MGSPACMGNPVQAGSSASGSLALVRLLRALTVRLGRVRQAVASMLPPGIRSRSVNQALRSSEPRVKGCRAGVSPGPSGEATRQVSAQTSSAGCPELLEVRMAGSQVACSRLMAPTRAGSGECYGAREHCRSTAARLVGAPTSPMPSHRSASCQGVRAFQGCERHRLPPRDRPVSAGHPVRRGANETPTIRKTARIRRNESQGLSPSPGRSRQR